MGQEGWLSDSLILSMISMILLLLEVVFLCFLVEVLVFVFFVEKEQEGWRQKLGSEICHC